MNTAAKVVIGLGVLVLIIGIILFATTGDDFEDDIDEGIIYEGADGKTKVENVEPNTGSNYWVHLVDREFEGGGGGGYNEAHGNSTWNLTKPDCDIVRSFTLTYDDNQIFYPQCNYIEDGTEDKYIVIGRLCSTPIYDRYGWEVGNEGEGCREGTYTWDTDGNKVMVYDFGAIIGAIFDIIMKGLGSFGACCCGSLILIIGIVLAFTMDDPKEPAINPITTNSEQQNVPEKKGASSWDEREDYIHRTNDKTKSDFEKADKDGDGKIDEEEFADMMKSQMAIPEDSEDKPKEKKRSGKYDLPPPPEY